MKWGSSENFINRKILLARDISKFLHMFFPGLKITSNVTESRDRPETAFGSPVQTGHPNIAGMIGLKTIGQKANLNVSTPLSK
jgi:hypothetical protein